MIQKHEIINVFRFCLNCFVSVYNEVQGETKFQ